MSPRCQHAPSLGVSGHFDGGADGYDVHVWVTLFDQTALKPCMNHLDLWFMSEYLRIDPSGQRRDE